MPVPASINDLSTTAGSNSPPGSESPATLDDYIRALSAFIAQLRDGKQVSDALLTAIAALTTANGQFIALTGVDTVAARSIVGTVSQSGGIPTGALVERGSNANGEYVRFADGTQICTYTTGAIGATTVSGNSWISSASTWTYPAAFVAGSEPVVTGSPNTGAGYISNNSAPTNTSASWVRVAMFSDSTVRASRLMAVGRWF